MLVFGLFSDIGHLLGLMKKSEKKSYSGQNNYFGIFGINFEKIFNFPKPSEISHESAKLMFEELPNYLDKEAFPVFLEGPEGSGRLLKERYDLIFFTGGTSIGRIVMRAAAEYLTPVILELGGKNPTWFDKSADMKTAVQR